jgi:prepilin-type N-terminal cleavage/methylation domain-containing protein
VRFLSGLTPTARHRDARRLDARRHAFSLLEVLLALAILTVGLTACLALIELGVRSAREARDQTRAQEICESVLGLITSGMLDATTKQGEQPVTSIWNQAGIGSGVVADDLELQAEEDQWLCSIASEPSDVDVNVLKVTVTVRENALSSTPVEFTLVRWLLNPTYVQELTEANQQVSQSMSQQATTSQQGTTGQR